MNSLMIKAAGTLILLAGLLLSFACSPAANNSNQNQNNAAAENSANKSTAGIFDPGRDKSCDVAGLEERRTAVERRMIEKIESDPQLAKMFKGYDGNPARFSFVVEAKRGRVRDYLEVYIQGMINKNDQLNDFAGEWDNFLHEGCVQRVYFMPPGPLGGVRPPVPGFVWDYCEYPMQACPNGECRRDCSAVEPPLGNANATPPVSSNGNQNSNPNSNSNSNATGVNRAY